MATDIVLSLQAMDFHSNGMVFQAFDADGSVLARRVYYSVGGGFVVDEEEAATGTADDADAALSRSVRGAELVALADENRCSIADLVARNEAALGQSGWRCAPGCCGSGRRCASAWTAGSAADGTLPGALHVRRRARALATSSGG